MVSAFHAPLHRAHRRPSYPRMLVFPPFSVHPPGCGLPPVARESYVPLVSTKPASVAFFFWSFCCCSVFLYYWGYCLPLGETFVFEFVLVLFFTVVLVLTFNSTFTTSAFFRRWLLIPMGIDMLVLFSTFFTYETALCGLLKGPDHFFFVLFPTLCSTVWFMQGLLLENPPLFLL